MNEHESECMFMPERAPACVCMFMHELSFIIRASNRLRARTFMHSFGAGGLQAHTFDFGSREHQRRADVEPRGLGVGVSGERLGVLEPSAGLVVEGEAGRAERVAAESGR